MSVRHGCTQHGEDTTADHTSNANCHGPQKANLWGNLDYAGTTPVVASDDGAARIFFSYIVTIVRLDKY